MTSSEIVERIKNWCDRQERCHMEVRNKLATWKVFGHDAEEIISLLIEKNYLNEERFAKAYATGKFRMKRWGKRKITEGLKLRRISSFCIRSAMQEIDEEEYIDVIHYWVDRKNEDWKSMKLFDRRGKICQFLVRKGFEQDLSWDIILNKVK